MKSHGQFQSSKPQQGVVLIVSLVFLIALTAVAVALVQYKSMSVLAPVLHSSPTVATS